MNKEWVISKLDRIVQDLRMNNSDYAKQHEIMTESTKQYKIDQAIDRIENLIDIIADAHSQGQGPMIG